MKSLGDSRILTDSLDGLDFAACSGEFSLQSSLNMALQDLQQVQI
jgi:hypothetical protein